VTVAAEPRRCQSCDRELASTSRPDRRYCGAACRQRGYERRRGEAHGLAVEPATALLADLEHALGQATSEVVLVAQVASAAKTNWRAAAWLLERRFPERWGRARRPADDDEPTPPATEPDPFAEVDELAERRRQGHEYGPSPKRR